MEELLDFRNQNLWNEINQKYIVEIEETTNKEYSVYSINNSATFFINKNNLCKTRSLTKCFMSIWKLKICIFQVLLN